jgi:hypothetical protein
MVVGQVEPQQAALVRAAGRTASDLGLCLPDIVGQVAAQAAAGYRIELRRLATIDDHWERQGAQRVHFGSLVVKLMTQRAALVLRLDRFILGEGGVLGF